MSDIRINALATTATTSASDDYVAIDGSANGTRKLSAYSPTFGGKIVASGSQTWASASAAQLFYNSATGINIAGNGSSYDVSILNKNGDLVFYNPTGTQNATLAGNLTVSGTGGITASASSGGAFFGATSQNTATNGFSGFRATNDAGGATRSVDYGVGGTSAGGNFSNYGYIAAGSALTGFRIFSGGTTLAATFDSSANTTLAGNLTVSGGTVTSGTGALTLNSSGNSVLLQSAGTTALTLDSSQNATFAGKVSSDISLSGDSIGIFKNTNANGYGFSIRGGSASRYAFAVTDYAGNSAMEVLGNGNATFAGAIAIGNTVAAAASVASTHKVTISIGGVTYYLLASNV